MRGILNREAIVLVATVAILGLLALGSDGERPALRGRRGVESLELEPRIVPDPARVLPLDAAGEPPRGRDLFRPPSDTRPLPPLAFEEPWREPLALVAAPPVPGPAPELYDDLLLRRASERALGPLDLARQRGVRTGAGTGTGAPAADEDEGARLATSKALYDWVRLTSQRTIFGSITNEDRYGLFLHGARDDEPLRFVQVDPRTGEERFPGAGALVFERARVADFGLAETAANAIELEYRRLAGRVTAATYADLLALAERCIEDRHEAPRALAIAEEICRELVTVDPDDPRPGILLARTFEARFDFESAFDQYESMLERFAHRADVFVALADLERRCLLYDSALERLLEAVRVERTSWRAHWALGRLFLDRGRGEKALVHLATANRHAPEDPGYLATRVAMRADLARAHVRQGELDAARSQAGLALSLDPDRQEALAVLVACAVLSGEAASGSFVLPEGATDGVLEFDLLLGLGLFELERGEPETAREHLLDAAALDPLRASLAWRSLSHLFDLAGSDTEAWRYADLAYEADPLDPWTLYQRGRLLAERDDLEGAREAFEDALELELDFDEALLALADVAFRSGRHDEAERYLERAADRLPGRREVFALRGANALAEGRFFDAAESFRRALALAADDAYARGGLAWCAYRTGDAEEALVQLAELEDSRRDLPEDDVHRAWARRQIRRLGDHLTKVEWRDGFERTVLRNGWEVDEGAGPLVEPVDGAVRIGGTFTSSGSVRLYRDYPGDRLVSFEARVRIGGESAVRAGIFVGRERRRGGGRVTTSEASLARHRDGALEVRLKRSSSDDGEVRKTDAVAFPTDRWVDVRIERAEVADRDQDARDADPTAGVRVFIDDIPLLDGAPLPELWRASAAVRIGAFVEGDTGRRADLLFDDVRVVYREEGR